MGAGTVVWCGVLWYRQAVVESFTGPKTSDGQAI